MSKRCFSHGAAFGRAGSAVAAKALLFAASMCFIAGSIHALAQQPLSSLLNVPASPDKSKHSKHNAPENPAPEPNIVIPVTPLGFAPPAPFYLGRGLAQVSLSFIDEDNLLFTFRVPGLIVREKQKSDQSSPNELSQTPRHIRAVVIQLPTGKVTAEALWELHDCARYLWPLKDGRFLLRDRNTVQMGDAALRLEPFLRFPGVVNSLQLPPDQRLLVADTTEPPVPEAKAETKGDSKPAAAARVSIANQFPFDGGEESSMQDLLRVLRMDNRTVMLFSRVHGSARLPIDGEGYYEALRGKAGNWLINYQQFRGASEPLMSVDSNCSPALDVPASGIVLASTCTEGGGRRIYAIAQNQDKSKRRLWDAVVSPYKVWPQIASSFDGRRVAWATLDVARPVGISSPIDRDDIRGESVQIYDLATGKTPLTVAASPALDGGGNFALSASGNRFAVLNAGSIQIFDLSPAGDLQPPSDVEP